MDGACDEPRLLGLDGAPLLFGRDRTPRIVAADLTDGGRAIRLHRRLLDGVVAEVVPFSPFLLTSRDDIVAGTAGLVDLEALAGGGVLRCLARFASWPDALGARDACRAAAGDEPAAAATWWFPDDPVHQYLLTSGRTSFGGLAFADLHRLALDIEVVTTPGYGFPSAARPGDRVVAIALADSRGLRDVLRGDRMDERDLLEECTRVIRALDPDVIEGHNIFRFDLEYLEARARLWGVALAWGRDGSPLRARPARLSVAERTIAYRRYDISGRHVIDTWMLAQLHDVGARDLPSFGLKDLARHFGIAAPDRTYIDPSTIARQLAEAPDRLMAYAADDAVETLGVSAILSPPSFAQAQALPFDYQSTVLRGAAAKIDALLVREYLAQRHALPAPRPGTSVGGGLVAILKQGVARPVLHVDVTSLYPSLMLAAGIAPDTDELGVFPALLDHLRAFRVRAKRLAREATDPGERAHAGALQQSFKILINAFYGYLAFGAGHFNDYEAANRVTAAGREVVATMLERLDALGAIPLEADTDGVYFVPPPGHGEDDDERLLARLTEGLPPGIHLELDARYAAMLSYKLKTYALLDQEGRVSLKGSAFRSRGIEPFQRQLIEEIVRLLLTGRARDVKAVVERWHDDFASRRVPARAFARTETLAETLETYRERLAAGLRHPAAAYELAAASGRAWQPGDQVTYYVAGRGRDGALTDRAKLLDAWDRAHPDENMEYYRARVGEIWERFRPFVERDGLWPVEEPAPDDGGQLSLF